MDRPTKHLKTESLRADDGGKRSANGLMHGVDGDLEEARMLPLPSVAPDTVEWQATIEAVIKNVVSIRFCQTCPFDTDPAFSSEATGFVVDAERGYILTNRHVVGAGPFWGYCIFDNHEEVREQAGNHPFRSNR